MDNFQILANLYYDYHYNEISDLKKSCFFDDIEKDSKKIKDLLKQEDKKLVDRFKQGILNCCEERDFLNIVDALNYGIKIGMELQEFFHGLD